VVIENWLLIKGHSGYEISSLGRVRSYRNRQGHPIDEPRIMTPGIVKGYPSIKLGRTFQAKVHTLVLETFIGPKPDGYVCRHLDGNSENNAVDNLCWGTQEENYEDRKRHGTDNTGSKNGMSTISEKEAREIKTLLRGNSIDEIAALKNVSRSVVAHIYYGRTWKHV